MGEEAGGGYSESISGIWEDLYLCVEAILTKKDKNPTRKEKKPTSLLYFLQGAGPTGKNEEKIQVLTDKIDVLLQQVRFSP